MRRLLPLALALTIGGCDRPVVDLAPPRVEVVRPADLDVVQTANRIELAVRADVFGDITAVEVGGQETTLNPTDGTYEIEVGLRSGLNVLPVDVFDAAGLRGSDTLYVFQGDLRADPLPTAPPPPPATDLAASPLPSGDVFISGGASSSGQVRRSGYVVSTASNIYSFREVALRSPRTGHSSTLLPDGRVLLVGGASSVSPLATTRNAEVVDPASGASAVVPLREGTVSRVGHTARLLTFDGISLLSIYGGIDALGVPLSTVDILRWDGDALTVVTPEGGASGGFPAFRAPAQSPVGALGAAEGAAAVFGLAEDPQATSAFGLEWFAPSSPTLPFDLEGREIAPLATPREAAAAVSVGGAVLVCGGQDTDGTTLDTFEVYVPAADRTFRFPDSVRLGIPRSGHTATLTGSGRILIAGGRDASGNALLSAETFQF